MAPPRPTPPVPPPVPHPPRRGRLRRLREIVAVLARHGFGYFIEHTPLAHFAAAALLRNKTLAPRGETPGSVAERFAAALEELGPVFVKFGQMLSTRPDLLPEDFIAELERLQDQVPPEPPAETAATFERAFGRSPDDTFASFNPVPLACGSMAQAYRAVLPDGRDVVVKIKRAGIDATVREDLALLRWMAEVLGRLPDLEPLDPRQIVREFAAALERELDFTAEAASAAKFAELARGNTRLLVPAIHWAYVHRDVLVLDHAPGRHLSDPGALDAPPRPLDRAKVAGTLAHAFMRQYFTTGFFHADPHPGNIFVVDEERIALVDFGQMGRVPDTLRRRFALLLAALAKNDDDFAAEIVADLGNAESPGADSAFRAEFRTFVDRFFGTPAERIDLGQVIHGALDIARHHGLRLPRELVMLAKSLVTVAGVIRRIDPEFRFDRAVRPYAREVLSPRSVARDLPRHGRLQMYRWFRLAAETPGAIHELLEKTRRGHLRIVFQHEGLEARFAQAETAINRLAIGLIVAGITIGSAIVLAGGSGTEDLGDLNLPVQRTIPITVAIAGLGLSAAILIGLWVIWGVYRTPRKPPPDDDAWTP